MGVGMTKKKRAAIYLRVSTSSQTTENQLRELRGVAVQRGWHIVDVYEDRGVSGSKGRDSRPSFDRLHKDAARGKFDVVLAWSIDRLGRSLHHVVAFMAEIGQLGIDLYLHQQAVDSSTRSGRAMLSMCGVFAEFERGIIAERVRAGLERARAQGKQLGRPRISDELERAIRQRRAHGTGILKIAREVGVGVSVVQRVIRQAA
jgi:DNA invertase Pin-like site-specific DNA recombinase